MTEPVIAERTFDAAAQEAFATLSGDRNPLHMDPVAARRTSFGHAIVHGVHLVLWTLDRALASSPGPRRIAALRVVFRQPVRVGETVRAKITLEGDGRFNAVLDVSGKNVVRITGALAPAEGSGIAVADEVPGAIFCRAPSFAEAAQASGRLSLGIAPALAGSLFPAGAVHLPRVELAELCALTRIVGMECPGLHSTFAEIDVKAVAGEEGLGYRVDLADDRFSLLRLAVTGPTLGGTIKAFYRPPPQAQTSAADLARLVTPGELAGQRVLVVGGSRGLGEVAAKLAGVAGADVVVTCHRGIEDARRVADEIAGAGGSCRVVQLDVTALPSDLAAVLGEGWVPSQIVYFATPFISVEETKGFSRAKFDVFATYYVDGFAGLVQRVRGMGQGPLACLYPSTVFLDAPLAGTAEYCAAKAAGETLCQHLALAYPGTRFTTPRLPRMRTDQTLSMIPIAAETPDAIVLAALRALA